jgi:serine O-acetyltransferase
MGVNLERFFRLMKKQIMAGLCFAIDPNDECFCVDETRKKAIEITNAVIKKLPEIRNVLATDVEAAFNGDPAATSFGEIISCYPVIRTLSNYRLAHELHLLGVPLIPRMITELAHSETGIDIHPAAQIGHHFTIDHGTGVVICATCIIGNNVKLYQGVTLGALSFPLDKDGNPIKGIPRHPILEDDVIIYSNATILGRITIGKGSVIGANKWVTDNVASNSKIYKNVKIHHGFENGYGI